MKMRLVAFAAALLAASAVADGAEGFWKDKESRFLSARFSGDMRDAASFDPDGEIAALFERTANLYTAYLASVRPDCGMDFREWSNVRN